MLPVQFTLEVMLTFHTVSYILTQMKGIWLCLCFFCLCRRSCSPFPSWCLWWSASQHLSTFISSFLKPKIKHLWTSVRVLPRSTKSPSLLPAKKWRCFEMSLRWRIPSSWATYSNCGEALKTNLKIFVVCTYLFYNCEQWIKSLLLVVVAVQCI